MKPTLHHRPVNGVFEDPAVYVRVIREGTAMLLDAGDISSLSIRELLKLGSVFITHMHIDHFIGFDTILRALLKRPDPVTFFGPAGIMDCVEGRLRGYTWNLIADYPIAVEVIEVRRDTHIRALFRAGEEFVRRDIGATPAAEVLLENDILVVKALHLDHAIPALGFSIEEKVHINIDKARLADRGFTVGPWLSLLKNSVRTASWDVAVDTGNGVFPISELTDLYSITRGQKICYVMDASPIDDNIDRIVEFVEGADTLYIEAYFKDADAGLARERHHLTAAAAGNIARRAEVRDMRLLHMSPRYHEDPDSVIREANEAFRR